MAQVTFSLTQREPQTGRVLRAQTQADLSSHDLAALVKDLKAHGTPDVGNFATIYVAPEEYTLEVNGERIALKPQFFPPKHRDIINKLTSALKESSGL